ncbi:MAG: hypothetical protein RDU20_14470 [Desulfomonilaceae bacterium]|nr:hypothetical protein [Desulfomonilaceae bacterium]
MVKKMIVVLSAVALIITAVGVASAQMIAPLASGDMIMIPMKVTYSFTKNTSGTPGGDSTLMNPFSCEQYTAGFRPWGIWKGTTCTMKVEVHPPKCVGPAYGGPVAWGAPPALPPNSKLVSNVEKYQVNSPGCNPCVKPGLKYEMVKQQVVK